MLMIKKFAHWLSRRPRRILFVAILLLIPSLAGYAATKVNYDILSYLPTNIESVQGEKLLEEPFEAAATGMMIVENMPPKYTDNLLTQIKSVPHVSNAFWLSNSIGIQFPTELLPGDLQKDFFSSDSTIMIIQYDEPAASEDTMQAVSKIHKIMNKNCFLAGMSAMVEDTKEVMNEELPKYTSVAVLLTLIVLLISFESWLMPFLFLGCIGIAIVYNMGTNVFLGQISYLTKAIAAILQLGVTMDYSIFLYRRYEEERDKYADNRDAMAEAIAAAFTSLSGSSLTTIAGFLALCFMRLKLGSDMGIVMAKGVVIGVICVVLVLPSFILIFDKPINKYMHRQLLPDFAKLNAFMVRHRYLFLVIFLLSLIPAYYSQAHTQVYYKMDESLPKTLNSVVGNNKLKADFNMSTMHLVVMDGNLDNTKMSAMEDRLKNVKGIEKVYSFHKLLGSGIPDFFVPNDLRKIFKSGNYQLLIATSDYEVASDEVRNQLKEVSAIIKEYDPGAYITGESAMTEDMIEISDHDFDVTNYISIALIFLIIAIVFRSASIPVILILGIELAICINEGVPYFQGTVIPFVAPTIISAVQLGATVDYAILMTSRFQEEIRNGKSKEEAAIIAGRTSDPSILTSSLTLLCATLGVTLISQMAIVKEVCGMLARGAMISAAVTMFIVPSLLCIFEPVIRSTTYKWDGFTKKERAAKLKEAKA